MSTRDAVGPPSPPIGHVASASGNSHTSASSSGFPPNAENGSLLQDKASYPRLETTPGFPSPPLIHPEVLTAPSDSPSRPLLATLFNISLQVPQLNELLRFQPFRCTVDVQFWQFLGHEKLNKWKLDKPWVPIYGTYQPSSPSSAKFPSFFRIPAKALTTFDNTSSTLPPTSTSLRSKNLMDYSLSDPCSSNDVSTEVLNSSTITEAKTKTQLQASAADSPEGKLTKISYDTTYYMDGTLRNYNTIQEFKQCNRSEAIQQLILPFFSVNATEEPQTVAPKDRNEWRAGLTIKSAPNFITDTSICLIDLIDSWKGSYARLKTSAASQVHQQEHLTINHIMKQLNKFILLTYLDLKRYKVVYSIAFPTLNPVAAHFSLTRSPKELKDFSGIGDLDLVCYIDKFMLELTSKILTLQNEESSCIKDGVFWLVETRSFSGYKESTSIAEQQEKREEMDTAESQLQGNKLCCVDNLVKIYPIDSFLEVVDLFRNSELPERLKESETAAEQTKGKDEALGESYFVSKALENIILCYMDPSSSVDFIGWSLRNILYVLTVRFKLFGKSLKILAYRDAFYLKKDFTHFKEAQTPQTRMQYSNSVLFYVSLPEMSDFFGYCAAHRSTLEELKLQEDLVSAFSMGSENIPFTLRGLYANTVSGWLKYGVPGDVKGSYTSVYTISLNEFLDNLTIQKNSIDMNVKLIRWRMIPEFIPDKIQNLSFLLIGAGALGSAVARTLIGWGVRKITFVDNGRVSMSNPSRQLLYSHSDATAHGGLGSWKALAAKQRILEVRPDILCDAFVLDVPTPGHHGIMQNDEFDCAYTQLKSLIDSHDVIFLLTDSRESRWLPSLMVTAKQYHYAQASKELQVWPPPVCITVAIGFDSLVVMRHSYLDADLACYFCNDVSAPTDSISNRTLDQQCTVTRPGIATLASGLAVELVSSLTQHPRGFAAPHSSFDLYDRSGKAVEGSCLGATPHTIRMYLSEYKLVTLFTEPFVNCICCSPKIVSTFINEGIEFVKKVVLDSSLLEHISGLHAMKECIREDDVIALSDDEEEN